MKRASTPGLALAVVVMAALSLSGCSDSSGPSNQTPAADVTIVISANNGNLSFTPNPSAATVGQTVAWRNSMGMTHAIVADGGAFNTGDIAPNATSAPITMSTTGSFPYHCSIHPSMVGTLAINP